MCRVTIGHLMVTVGHPRVTRGNHRLIIGLQVTSFDIGQLRVGKEGGHCRSARVF